MLIKAVQLTVVASLVILCRKLRWNDDEPTPGIMLTKDAPREEGQSRSKSRPSLQRPPPNLPIAPPPRDPLDDTLSGVKSLKVEISGRAVAMVPRRRVKRK